MVYDKIIVDADLCLKLGSSTKHRYLEMLLPLLADNCYIHETVNREIMTDRAQIDALIDSGLLTVLSEGDLDKQEQTLYQETRAELGKVMSNPSEPRKNQGEMASLAMAKTKEIHFFATDERNLQPIIDAILNTGIDDPIRCVRVEDVVELIRKGQLGNLQRKDAKIIWIISKKSKEDFDKSLWPI